jgi:mono/diheme cytochrome c family protein
MRTMLCLALLILLGIVCRPAAAGSQGKGEESLPMASLAEFVQLCGICHLEDGQGVPGAFPPLDERLNHWAGSADGRAYLVGVLVNGLFGPITVAGQQYMGAMPGMANQLDSAQMAAMLNFILVEHAQSGDELLFSVTEVEQIRDRIGSSPSHPLRPAD